MNRLYMAVKNSNVKTLRSILADRNDHEKCLEIRREMNQLDEDGNAPIHVATRIAIEKSNLKGELEEDDLEVLRLLLKMGEDVNKQTKKGIAPIHMATEAGNIRLLDFLLSRDNLEIHIQNTPQVLTQPEWSMNERDKYYVPQPGNTPLHIAVENSNLEVIELFMKRKDMSYSYSRVDQNGDTPLNLAVKNGNLDMVKVLVELTFVDKEGSWPSFEKRYYVEYKVENKGEKRELVGINHPNKEGNSPIHTAILMRNQMVKVQEYIIALLLQPKKNGLDVEKQNKDGKTPLNLAIEVGKARIVGWLLACGASPKGRNKDGITAVEQAFKKMDTEIIAYLINALRLVSLEYVDEILEWRSLDQGKGKLENFKQRIEDLKNLDLQQRVGLTKINSFLGKRYLKSHSLSPSRTGFPELIQETALKKRLLECHQTLAYGEPKDDASPENKTFLVGYKKLPTDVQAGILEYVKGKKLDNDERKALVLRTFRSKKS